MAGEISNILLFHLISLFVISGVAKLFTIKDFIKLIVQINILPERIAVGFAVLLPFLELLGAAMLLALPIHFGATFLGFLLFSFIYASFRIIREGKVVSCGCYGLMLNSKVDHFTFGKNLYLFLILFMLVLVRPFWIEGYAWLHIAFGLGLSALLLLFEKIWQIHSQTMIQLRKVE